MLVVLCTLPNVSIIYPSHWRLLFIICFYWCHGCDSGAATNDNGRCMETGLLGERPIRISSCQALGTFGRCGLQLAVCHPSCSGQHSAIIRFDTVLGVFTAAETGTHISHSFIIVPVARVIVADAKLSRNLSCGNARLGNMDLCGSFPSALRVARGRRAIQFPSWRRCLRHSCGLETSIVMDYHYGLYAAVS
jgi:hypothetical protein